MDAAVNASTASDPGCGPAVAELSSSAVASRAAIASRPDYERTPRRGYRSLRSSTEFSRAYQTGQRRRCGGVTVIAGPGPPGPASVGFVAGKRVGSAVVRNRAKRRMRAAVSRCGLKSDTVYVLIADRRVLTADFERLVRWIDRCTGEQSMALEKE